MDIVKLRELLEAELSSNELTELDGEFYREFDSLIKALKLSAESSRERGGRAWRSASTWPAGHSGKVNARDHQDKAPQDR